MKIGIFSLAVAAFLMGGVLTADAQQKAPSAVATPGASDWQSPDNLRQKLAAEISKRLTGIESSQIQAFIKNKENLQLLFMYHFACVDAGRQEEYRNHNASLPRNVQNKKDQIARLETEVKNKKGAEKKNAEYRLECAERDLKKLTAEAKYPIDLEKHAKVLKAILADVEWMEQIAFSGEMPRFARVVQIIDAIAAADKGALKKGVARDITTAVALEYARNNCKTVDAVDRAKYFLKYQRQGRLNTSFDKLPMHQRRVACGWKPEHRAGTVKAFEWALNNVHVPDWQYPASCWRCGYILDNVYGDSVHGSYYFAPWEGVATDNHMWLTKYVGGVCGGLSHFGAASACANGVPALTMGEPGHCAYVVLVDGRWTPAYSLTWERGLHWIPWDNNWTYSILHLTDELFDKKNADKTRLSNACRILARLWQDKSDTKNALACYELSAKSAPLNYPMWKEYSAFLGQHMPKDAEAWQKLNTVLCRGMAKGYPEQAAELLKQGILNSLADSGMGVDALTKACAQFWKHAEVMGPDRWYVEKFADAQLAACRKVGGDAESVRINLFISILKASAPHDAYSGMMMAWGNRISDGLSEGGRKQLSDSMVKVLGADKDISSAQKAKLLGGLILAAEKTHDTTTFYAISKMIDPKEIKGSAAIPDFRTFPGKLVSEGGLPFASSTSEWDAPHTHSGLLTKQGGRLHTGKDNNAWIAVKLPKHAYITGVVFAGTNAWELIHRFRPLRVQVSDTGRADDWHDVGPVIERTGNYINSFDLQKERPKALYVRVLRSGGPEFFHANGIYIYGEPAA
ncbi:MAG: hypothetical protein IKZ10_03875 [Akkermansia sp.]|nr:hypothetical protein [Akkermansia sp.]